MKTVAILGGGPAGSFAAERLASAGLKTIVFDVMLLQDSPSHADDESLIQTCAAAGNIRGFSRWNNRRASSKRASVWAIWLVFGALGWCK